MLRCSLTQAAVASWIESLRHRAIDICIDFNEVFRVNTCISTREWQKSLIFKKPGFISGKMMQMHVKHKKASVSVVFYSHLFCAAVTHSVPNARQ